MKRTAVIRTSDQMNVRIVIFAAAAKVICKNGGENMQRWDAAMSDRHRIDVLNAALCAIWPQLMP